MPKYSITRFEMCLASKAQAGVGGRGDQTGHVGGHGNALRIVGLIRTISRWGSESRSALGYPYLLLRSDRRQRCQGPLAQDEECV